MDRADRSRARGGPDQLVWVAHLDRNGVQRFQTRPLELAPDENDACQLCRTALAGDGCGAGLVSEFGLPGRERQELLWQQHEPGASLPSRHIARQKRTRPAGQPPVRRLSCVVRGRLVLLALLFQAEPFPLGFLRPGEWPATITPPRKQPKPLEVHQQQRRREKERRRAQKRRTRTRTSAQMSPQKTYTCKTPWPPLHL